MRTIPGAIASQGLSNDVFSFIIGNGLARSVHLSKILSELFGNASLR
jgi:hypothetical protein